MAMSAMIKGGTIDDHIKVFPVATRQKLEQIRSLISKAAPKAEECISYGIPTFKLEGNLVHFSGYKNHIGFYPGAGGIATFKKELSVYKGAKGSVQFPLDKPLPASLITKIVKFRVKQNTEKTAITTSKKAPATKPVRSTKSTDGEQVKNYIAKLDPAAKSDIEAVRKIIRSVSPKLNERIKWNAPSYYYKEDIVTFGPYKIHKLLLVFHHPAVVKVRSVLLQGDYKDRRLVYFKDKTEATKNKSELSRIIKEIMTAIDKK